MNSARSGCKHNSCRSVGFSDFVLGRPKFRCGLGKKMILHGEPWSRSILLVGSVLVWALFLCAERGFAQAPQITSAGVVNAASFVQGAVSGGSIVAIFGANLATGIAGATQVPLPTNLNGTQVFISGQAVPLFFVSAGQVNAQIPWELTGATQASISAIVNGTAGNTVTLNLTPFNPGVFTTDSSGKGQGAILIATTGEVAAPAGSLPGRPARPVNTREIISIYLTGLGDVSPRPPTGAPASGTPPLSETPTTPAVTIGGVPAQVVFSGLAPFFVGLYQVNALVADNTPGGSAVPVAVTIGGALSNTATIAVQGTTQGLANLSVSKTASPNPVNSGGVITYTLTVKNIGNADAQSVILTDPLPAGVSFVSCTTSTGSCTASGGTVTASLGTLAAGGSVTVTISATAPPGVASPIVITNTATVSTTSQQSSTANNQASVNVTVNPVLALSGISPTSGSTFGGTAVTITGTGFAAGTAVTFGGTAATNVAVVSNTSITATAPAHPTGAVDVVVTNPNGQSARMTNGYTYTLNLQGQWSGTTDQGDTLSFVVNSGNAITRLSGVVTIQGTFPGGTCTTISVYTINPTPPLALTGTRFTVTSPSLNMTVTVTGNFTSEMSASGSAVFTLVPAFGQPCSGSKSTAWTAKKS